MLDNVIFPNSHLKNKVFSTAFQHSVLITNLLIFFSSVIAGILLYYGTFSAGDALYTFVLRGGDYGSNPYEVSYFWYTQINGRVGQALIASLFSILSYFAPTPESFPWWIISTLELFFLIAAPVNFLFFLRRLLNISWSIFAFLLLMLWGFWSVNDIIYSPSHMHQAIEGYYLPVYLISLFFLSLLTKPFQSRHWSKWIIWGLLYFFLVIFGEQFFPTLPILFISISFANESRDKQPISYWVKLIGLFVILSIFAAIIFFISPGQNIRNSTMDASFGPLFSIERLFGWYQTYSTLGYNFLFHWSHNMPIWWGPSLVLFDWLPNFNVLELHNYLLLLPAVGLIISGWFLLYKQKNINSQSSTVLKTFQVSIISLSFFAAYLACLSTLIVSDYFPVYAGIIPAFFLACGLCCNFLLLFYLLDPVIYSKNIRYGNIYQPGLIEKKNQRKTKRIWLFIFSVMIGVIFSITLANRILFLWTYYYKVKTLIITCLAFTPILSAISYYFILNWTLRRLDNYFHIIKYVWLVLALFAGNYFWTTSIASTPLPSEWHTLTITATGEKNPKSLASEVWLQQIMFGKNNEVPFSSLDKTGIWFEDQGYLISKNDQPATLTLNFRSEGDKAIQLLFSEHQNAGYVVVKLDNDTQTLDLYDTGGDRVVILPIEGAFWQILLNHTEEFSIGLIVFVVSIWLLASPIERKWAKFQHQMALGFLALLLLIFCVLPNVRKSIVSYQTFHLTQSVRQLTYNHILETYKRTHQKNYFVIDCPEKSYYNHYGFDAYWGIKSYFLWVGIPNINVLVDQNELNRPLPPDINKYEKIKCIFPNTTG